VCVTRHADLDRSSREKDIELTKLREAARDKERHLEGTIQSLRTQLEEVEVARRQLEWTVTDLKKDKETTVET